MIAGEFNSLSPNNIHRTVESLKKFYENKKKEVRKIVACEKKEINLTGGGTTLKLTKDPSHELVLSLMNNKSVFGLTNPFDSDSINTEIILKVNNEHTPGPSIDNNVKQKTIDGLLFSSTANDETDLDSYEAQEDEYFEDIDTDSNKENTWKKYKPTDLQAPLSSPLQRCRNENLTQNTPVRKNKSVNRRRPATTVKALTSSHLAQKYNVLVDKRLAIADMVTKKIVTDVSMQKEEHSLKTKLLQKKIELKEEKLKLLKKQSALL